MFNLARVAATACLISSALALPALAGHAKASGGGGGGGPVVAVATDYLHAKARDLKVMAVAVPYNAESSNGSAAIVRVDDGSDGGNPVCHLLLLAGKPSSPGKVESSVKFTVCPRADQGKDTLLSRVQMGGKRYAWQLRLSTARYDAMAKGTEHSQHWALVAEMGTGPQVVFERTSTTFKSPSDPATNQAEVCQAPVIKGESEPESAEVACDVEMMLGKLAKRSKAVFRYVWQGDRFLAQ